MKRSSIDEASGLSEHSHIVYNRALLSDWGVDASALWSRAESAALERGRRGTVAFFSLAGASAAAELALKHYYRGGLFGRRLRDKYWYWGESRTRPWIEWRAVCALRDADLPVPVPVSARFKRRGRYYTADLITVSLRPARPLSVCLSEGELPAAAWRKIGVTIRRIGDAGVTHADLNAHNILYNAEGDGVFVVDFDRASLRRARAPHKPLIRLQQSLNKLHAQKKLRFTLGDWQALLTGYTEEDAKSL